MASRHVLLLGICGIEKRQVAHRLQEWCRTSHGQTLGIVDFEHDYLAISGEKPFASFLLDPPHEQIRQWREAWQRLIDSHALDQPVETLLLLMHGAVVKGQYGVRAVYDLNLLCKFAPHLVITLIDDVYDMWWRTEARARGEPWRGRPTLEQLLVARRVEQLAGDQIANQIHPRARHIVLSVKHPCECAARLILGQPRVVYLAFPISEPRRMASAENADTSGMTMVNSFHTTVYNFQNANSGVVFVSPISIDERPLSDLASKPAVDPIAQEGDRKVPVVQFARNSCRWPTSDYWPPHDTLATPPPGEDVQKPFPQRQLSDAAGAIRTDVAWRDYRLVLQADALAVFNPVLNNRPALSSGVHNEIEYAGQNGKPIYVYQDPEQDRDQVFAQFRRAEGSMGPSPIQELITVCESVDELLERAAGRNR